MLLIGCLKAKKSQVLFHNDSHTKKDSISKQFPYHSDTLPEDCLLCGDKSNTPLSFYWGEDNIDVIRLNTFNITYIGINRYDNYGNRIEKPIRGSSIKITNTGENRFSKDRIASGLLPGVAYWQNEMRKSIPAKPVFTDYSSLKNYVHIVGKIRDLVNQVTDADGVTTFFLYFVHIISSPLINPMLKLLTLHGESLLIGC